MKLYNTLTRKKDTFKPLGDTVKIYTCGLTVYSQPHIGNWTGYIYWDILIRLLRYEGYAVERTQNITDVGHLTSDDDAGEDKMEKGARVEGKTAWDVAKKYSEIASHEAYDVLRLIHPEHLAPATQYIEQQIAFARELERKGFTYIIEGDGVYFDTSKLDDYGKLARLDIEGLEAGARVSVEGKRNITDFAIWKFSPADTKRDMEWDSPWGKGFPGWHLECSVIARETLGDQIDIHTGGVDHIPVHHTNEIAQTESVTGKQFAAFWLHNNHIKVDGRKMGKSLGNIYTLSDILSRGFSAMDFKLAVIERHYRTEGNFTWDTLAAAHNRLHNWRNYAAMRHQIHDTLHQDEDKTSENYVQFYAGKQALVEALEDDLDTPRALAIIDQEFSKLDNTPIDRIHRASFVALLETIDEILGLYVLESTPDISDDAKQLLIERRRLRDSKDWGGSDRLRDELAALRITVKDTPSGTVWQYSD